MRAVSSLTVRRKHAVVLRSSAEIAQPIRIDPNRHDERTGFHACMALKRHAAKRNDFTIQGSNRPFAERPGRGFSPEHPAPAGGNGYRRRELFTEDEE